MGFYERCGYRVLNGHRYLDAGIWHQDMARIRQQHQHRGQFRPYRLGRSLTPGCTCLCGQQRD